MWLLREPLLHFLAIGALLFIVHAWRTDAPEERADRIVVTTDDVALLARVWEEQWRRPPTEDELAGLVEQYVREEVLYREALVVGLHRDDSIMRRRMIQKLEMLTQGLAEPIAPTEAELRAFFEANAEQFVEPVRLTFSHVYLNAEALGATADDVAEQLLMLLREASDDLDPALFGDRFLRRNHYDNLPPDQITEIFGVEFTDSVTDLEPGDWQGPVRSRYGIHLVRIEGRQESRLPEFAENRERILGELLARRRREISDEYYRRLRERYDVVIEQPEAGAADEEA